MRRMIRLTPLPNGWLIFISFATQDIDNIAPSSRGLLTNYILMAKPLGKAMRQN